MQSLKTLTLRAFKVNKAIPCSVTINQLRFCETKVGDGGGGGSSNKQWKAMREDYNDNSKVQMGTILQSKKFLDAAIKSCQADLKLKHVSIADYGSSTGANSSLAMSVIIDGLRQRFGEEATKSMSVVHVDLPTNSWSTLFQYVNDDNASYLKNNQGVFAFASGNSFYKQVLPPNSLHFGFSNYSLHWLSKLPMKIKNHCIYFYGSEEEKEAFELQAKEDWSNFLKARSAELVKGGVLVLHCLTKKTTPIESIEPGYTSARALRDRGIINDEELLNFNYRITMRSFEDCADKALLHSLGFEVVIAEEMPPPPNIFVEAFKKHGDIDRFVKDLVPCSKEEIIYLRIAFFVGTPNYYELQSVSRIS